MRWTSLQLHCPPTSVYSNAAPVDGLDKLVKAGKLKYYGVSVQDVDEAIKAMDYPIVSIQIIFNMLRQKPIDKLFDLARQKNVAIIARVPLASGLLTGKMKPDTKFGQDDHRNYNIRGEAFDVGETFSGVPYDVGLAAVEKLRPLVSQGRRASWRRLALRWILMHDAVTVAIPGAKNVAQAESNVAAGDLPGADQGADGGGEAGLRRRHPPARPSPLVSALNDHRHRQRHHRHPAHREDHRALRRQVHPARSSPRSSRRSPTAAPTAPPPTPSAMRRRKRAPRRSAPAFAPASSGRTWAS